MNNKLLKAWPDFAMSFSNKSRSFSRAGIDETGPSAMEMRSWKEDKINRITVKE